MKTSCIDRDMRTLVQKYIRQYDAYREWYDNEREEILHGANYSLPLAPAKTGAADPTQSKAQRLMKLDGSHRARVIAAIDGALLNIGADYAQGAQKKLREAIWLSCLDSRAYNFEAFAGFIACERATFYRHKKRFLCDIRDALGL